MLLVLFLTIAALTLLGLGGVVLILIILAGIAFISDISDSPTAPNPSPNIIQNDSTILAEEEKGDSNVLPQHLREQISKIIEAKTGKKFPRIKQMDEYLAQMPAQERAKLLPSLIPIFTDAFREATGMKLDASLALQEFSLGQGLGLTELDIANVTDNLKMEKFLVTHMQRKEIADHFRKEMGKDIVVDYVEDLFTVKSLQETFKDMPLPPGLSPMRMAKRLRPSRSDDDSQARQETIEEE